MESAKSEKLLDWFEAENLQKVWLNLIVLPLGTILLKQEFTVYIRVAMYVADHESLLTQWRYI